MKRVAIINGGHDYAHLFQSLGYEVVGVSEAPDLVCFTGGADVTPALYDDDQHPQTYNDTMRDARESSLFDRFNGNTPMVGICRGAQFLNVMSGGRMYQHVEKHTRSHAITDVETGETIYVSSTHHQMMMPSPDALLVATAALGGSREWYDGAVARKDVSEQDIEVVYYANTNCLCFQPHPEFDYPEYEGMKDYFSRLLSKYLGVA